MFAGVDPDEAYEEADIGGEGMLPDNTVLEELHDGCFEGRKDFFAEPYSWGVRKRGGMWKKAVREEATEGAGEVHEDESLPGVFYWGF